MQVVRANGGRSVSGRIMKKILRIAGSLHCLKC